MHGYKNNSTEGASPPVLLKLLLIFAGRRELGERSDRLCIELLYRESISCCNAVARVIAVSICLSGLLELILARIRYILEYSYRVGDGYLLVVVGVAAENPICRSRTFGSVGII